MSLLFRILLLAMVAMAAPAQAVQPDEMLADPAQERRAQDLGREIRCLVCRSESIEASNADFARDMRLVVRERIAAGDSDAEVRTYLTERFGEYILLRPRFGGTTLALWLAGPALLVLGGAVALIYIRRRSAGPAEALSEEESARLEALLAGDDPERQA